MSTNSNETFIHPNAICETKSIGERTRVWAFAHLLPGAEVGRDCNICDGVFVEDDVRIGDRVTNVAEDVVFLATGDIEDLNP